MINSLKENIETEIKILREISRLYSEYDLSSPTEKRLFIKTVSSLKKSMKIINNSVPDLLKKISPIKKLNEKTEKDDLESVEVRSGSVRLDVTLKVIDKDKFLDELHISDRLLKTLRKKRKDKSKKKKGYEYRGSRGFLKFSNLIFQKFSKSLIEKGSFKNMSRELRKSNLDILFETYIAMIFLVTSLAFGLSILLVLFLLFFNIGITPPYISVFDGSIFERLLKTFWIALALPGIVFLFVYFYPITERKTAAKKINQELPFAVIHMSSISGSGIEPSKIFKIIGMSEDYPYLRKEIRKVLNQINVYGYDLVTALNNTAKMTPSKELSELFSGLSTTIHSGGSLSDFFDKRAKTLLHSYTVEREKFTKLAETFMDIYISVVLATPMILILLLIIMSVSGLNVGFTPFQISALTVIIIALINVIFLGVLHVKQPAY
jgi:hypothetical protein